MIGLVRCIFRNALCRNYTDKARDTAPVTSTTFFISLKCSFIKNVGMYIRRPTKCLLYAQPSEQRQRKKSGIVIQ